MSFVIFSEGHTEKQCLVQRKTATLTNTSLQKFQQAKVIKDKHSVLYRAHTQ